MTAVDADAALWDEAVAGEVAFWMPMPREFGEADVGDGWVVLKEKPYVDFYAVLGVDGRPGLSWNTRLVLGRRLAKKAGRKAA